MEPRNKPHISTFLGTPDCAKSKQATRNNFREDSYKKAQKYGKNFLPCVFESILYREFSNE